MNDPTQFAQQVAELIREQVARATAPLIERLATLEARPEPKDGTSVTVEDVMPTLLASIPAPIAGEPGTSVTVEDVMPTLLAAIPAPIAGEPGTSVQLDQVLAVITPRVDEAIAALPVPKDGVSVSLDDVKGLIESNMAGWALDFERRAHDTLGRALDRMPAPKDGRDATSLEDIDLVLAEDGRTLVVRFLAGDVVREKSIRLATILDRGVFKRGDTYEPGDAVSWGGALWIAQTKTGDSPDESRDGTPWRLAVKKGRDGKDLRPDDIKSAEVYRLRGNRT